MAGLFIGFLVEKCPACQSWKSYFGWNRFCFPPCLMRKRVGKSRVFLALLYSCQELHLEWKAWVILVSDVYFVWLVLFCCCFFFLISWSRTYFNLCGLFVHVCKIWDNDLTYPIRFDQINHSIKELKNLFKIRTCINKIYKSYGYVIILFNFENNSINIYI